MLKNNGEDMECSY